MSFARLRTADWVAMLAALVLLFVMAIDWYTTAEGEHARSIQRSTQGNFGGGEEGEDIHNLNRQARYFAQSQEKNAWQESGAVDRVILLVLVAAVVLTLASGFLRAAGRRYRPPLTPSGLAAATAAAGALLVTYRLFQKPGVDDVVRIKPGVPIAIVVLGVIALACARGLKHEEEGEAFRELPKPPEPPAGEEPAAS